MNTTLKLYVPDQTTTFEKRWHGMFNDLHPYTFHIFKDKICESMHERLGEDWKSKRFANALEDVLDYELARKEICAHARSILVPARYKRSTFNSMWRACEELGV